VAAYLAVAFGVELGLALAFHHSASQWAPMLSILVPTLAVAVTTVVAVPRGRRRAVWAGIGLGRGGPRFWPIALAVPALVVALPYLVAGLCGLVTFPRLGAALPDLFAETVVFTVVILGEEIGWRGFLLPRLRELTSSRRAAAATGLLHGLFHVPLITLTASYDSVGSPWAVAPTVVVAVGAAGVFYAWLRERSGGIWPVAIAHNAVNTVFDVATTAGVTASPVALSYVAGESGLVTMGMVIVVAAFLWRRADWRG
jgi:membrane protease YdiL (CAAX protease family)